VTHLIENNQLYTNGVIERDTGIGCDTLRVREHRDGFPGLVHNEKVGRVYPEIEEIQAFITGKVVPLLRMVGGCRFYGHSVKPFSVF